MQYTVLIVEDDKNIQEFLEQSFKDAQYRVRTTGDGAKALSIIKEGLIDLVVLDLGLESISGESVCIESKKLFPELPIIILTAKNTSQDVIRGLDIGADDYISKPFEIEEVLARARVRLKQQQGSIIQLDDLVVNSASMQVKRGEKEIPLTAKEFKLLEYLLKNKGIVLSRETILDHVWLYSPDIDTRVVDVYIGYLRKKIDEGHSKKLIKSVRGFGYTIRQ